MGQAVSYSRLLNIFVSLDRLGIYIDWTLQYTITDSWYDDEGNLFVKYEGALDFAQQSSHAYFLNKFSNDGTVWEMVWSGVDYPNEVSLIGGNYRIYYRQ